MLVRGAGVFLMKIGKFILFFVLVSCSGSVTAMMRNARRAANAPRGGGVAAAAQAPEIILLTDPRSCAVASHVCVCLNVGAEQSLVNRGQHGEWNIRFCQNLKIFGARFRPGNRLLLSGEVADAILAAQYSDDGCLNDYRGVLAGFCKVRIDSVRIMCTMNPGTKTIVIHEVRERGNGTYNDNHEFAAAHANCALYPLREQPVP
jgi:hypothetical protein